MLKRHTIHCDNWDSFKPRYLTDIRTGQVIGTLRPRATQAELGYGIAAHSKPEIETRYPGT